jgi:hypothetical protein
MRPLHRYDAHATIVPDEYEAIIGGRTGLLRLVLSDDGPLTDPDTGRQYTQPDVFCRLNAHQARQLADRLRALADQLTTTTSPTRTTP